MVEFLVEIAAEVEVAFEVEFGFRQHRLESFWGWYHIPAMYFWPRITCRAVY